MDLAPYLEHLHAQLALAASGGDERDRACADRLAGALDPAARLALLDALSAAAAEITAELAPASVEVRLRGRDPELVVTPAPAGADASRAPAALEPPPAPATGADGALARINLRLPQELKDQVDDAARAAGLSVNAWLVRAAAASLPRGSSATARPAARPGQHDSGWFR